MCISCLSLISLPFSPSMFFCFLNFSSTSRNLAEIFMVLPTRKELPDYYQIIKHPVDIRKIRVRFLSIVFLFFLFFFFFFFFFFFLTKSFSFVVVVNLLAPDNCGRGCGSQNTVRPTLSARSVFVMTFRDANFYLLQYIRGGLWVPLPKASSKIFERNHV